MLYHCGLSSAVHLWRYSFRVRCYRHTEHIQSVFLHRGPIERVQWNQKPGLSFGIIFWIGFIGEHWNNLVFNYFDQMKNIKHLLIFLCLRFAVFLFQLYKSIWRFYSGLWEIAICIFDIFCFTFQRLNNTSWKLLSKFIDNEKCCWL